MTEKGVAHLETKEDYKSPFSSSSFSTTTSESPPQSSSGPSTINHSESSAAPRCFSVVADPSDLKKDPRPRSRHSLPPKQNSQNQSRRDLRVSPSLSDACLRRRSWQNSSSQRRRFGGRSTVEEGMRCRLSAFRFGR